MNPLFITDNYKVGHPFMYHPSMLTLESNMTARSSKRFNGTSAFDNKVVVLGILGLVKEYFVDSFNRNFFSQPVDSVVNEYKELMDGVFGPDVIKVDLIRCLHKLQKLPIRVQGLPEGVRVPIGIPFIRIKNTVKGFGWLTNYLETLTSNYLWPMITNATIAFEFRRVLEQAALDTVGEANPFVVGYQAHDFSLRGITDRTGSVGFPHLAAFIGSDNVPSIWYAKNIYNATGYIAGSVPATEHSVASSNILNISYHLNKFGKFEKWKRDESIPVLEQAEEIFIVKMITEVFPTGIFSYVSDTFDYWGVLTRIYPRIKDIILSRKDTDSPVPTRLVTRPDSGDPVEIICGIEVQKVESLEYVDDYLRDAALEGVAHGECGNSEVSMIVSCQGKTYKAEAGVEWDRHDKQYYYLDSLYDVKTTEIELTAEQKGSIEVLWDLFGGTVTPKGFKQLNSKVGLIYGDSITMENLEEIIRRLADKGFASTNVIFGIGSFTYQFNTRDTFGMAIKATHATFSSENGEYSVDLYKDPKTGDSEKKSAKGLVAVFKDDNGYWLKQEATEEDQKNDAFITYYDAGDIGEEIFINQSINLESIRNNLLSYLPK